jgi:hypothetical protein
MIKQIMVVGRKIAKIGQNQGFPYINLAQNSKCSNLLKNAYNSMKLGQIMCLNEFLRFQLLKTSFLLFSRSFGQIPFSGILLYKSSPKLKML